MELKRGVAGREALVQRGQYVRSHARAHRRGEPVWGAVVAREFTPDVIDTVGASSFPIALFAFAGSPRSLNVARVASSWPETDPTTSD